MVSKLTGNINGETVIFENKGDIWSADVPNMPNGKYVIELTAYDEAGNSAFKTAVLFTVNTEYIKVEILSGYYCEFLGDDYKLVIKEEEACIDGVVGYE